MPEHPFYRTFPAQPPVPLIHLSFLDRSSFLRLSPTGLTCSSDRGFRSVRTNLSVREGSWYYEAIIERGDASTGNGSGSGGDTGNAHVRLGWGRREAQLDAPVGMDGYSYAIRDVSGEKVHLSRPKPYGKPFGTGDVVGCLITLPPRDKGPKSEHDPARIKRKRTPLNFRNAPFFEMKEYPLAREMEALVDREGKGAAAAKAAAEAQRSADTEAMTNGKKKSTAGPTTKNTTKAKGKNKPEPIVVTRTPTVLKDSKIEFFLNGEPFGSAFESLYDFLPLPPLPPHTPAGQKKTTHGQSEGKGVIHDDGTMGYYPMISVFGKGKVRCNFGPEWIKPPHSLPSGCKPMSDRWAEFRAEEEELDEKEEAEMILELEKIMRKRAEMEAFHEKMGKGKAPPPDKKKKKANPTANGHSHGGTPASTPLNGALRDTSTPAREASVMTSRTADDGTPVKQEIRSRAGTEFEYGMVLDADVPDSAASPAPGGLVAATPARGVDGGEDKEHVMDVDVVKEEV